MSSEDQTHIYLVDPDVQIAVVDSSTASHASEKPHVAPTPGALCVDEASNFDRDGEARFFGTTSGRLEFKSSACQCPFSPELQVSR